jgi:hypothetical protein
VLCFILLVNFGVSHLPIGSSPYLPGAIADHREFEVDKFEENLTIQPNAFQTIDFNLQEGEKIEVVFTLQVKEALPVDVWFLNEDHYLLLVNGAQFLFFIDGSEQEVTYTRKIVTLTEHDNYKLVIANYNNQTVEANIIYEIRTYYAETGETSSEDLPIFLYPLLLAVVILVVLVIVLLFKTRNYKQTISNISEKASIKKGEKRKPKKAKPKIPKKATLKKADARRPKYVVPKATAEEPSEKAETVVLEQEEPKVSEKVTPKFCGHCGKPVTTQFCTHCGRKVEII